MIRDLEDFKVYKLAMKLGDDVWNVVMQWDSFPRYSIGTQLVKAVDSIAANLAEGLGRFHFKDARNFSYYSRGSLYETKTWLTKAFNRGLITNPQFKKCLSDIEVIGKMINSYTKSIGNTTREPEQPYGSVFDEDNIA